MNQQFRPKLRSRLDDRTGTNQSRSELSRAPNDKVRTHIKIHRLPAITSGVTEIPASNKLSLAVKRATQSADTPSAARAKGKRSPDRTASYILRRAHQSDAVVQRLKLGQNPSFVMDVLRGSDTSMSNVPRQVLQWKGSREYLDPQVNHTLLNAAAGFRTSDGRLAIRVPNSNANAGNGQALPDQSKSFAAGVAATAQGGNGTSPPSSSSALHDIGRRELDKGAGTGSRRFVSLGASAAGVGTGFGYTSVVGVGRAGPGALVSANKLRARLLAVSRDTMRGWEDEDEDEDEDGGGDSGRKEEVRGDARMPFERGLKSGNSADSGSESGVDEYDDDRDVDVGSLQSLARAGVDSSVGEGTTGKGNREISSTKGYYRGGASKYQGKKPVSLKKSRDYVRAGGSISHRGVVTQRSSGSADRDALGMPLLDALAAETLLPEVTPMQAAAMARAVQATKVALMARGTMLEPQVLHYATRRAADEAAALVRIAEAEEAGASLYKSMAHRLNSGNASRMARRYAEGRILLKAGQYPSRSADPEVASSAMMEVTDSATRLVKLQRMQAGRLKQQRELDEQMAARRKAARMGQESAQNVVIRGEQKSEGGGSGTGSVSVESARQTESQRGGQLPSVASFAFRQARLLGEGGGHSTVADGQTSLGSSALNGEQHGDTRSSSSARSSVDMSREEEDGTDETGLPMHLPGTSIMYGSMIAFRNAASGGFLRLAAYAAPEAPNATEMAEALRDARREDERAARAAEGFEGKGEDAARIEDGKQSGGAGAGGNIDILHGNTGAGWAGAMSVVTHDATRIRKDARKSRIAMPRPGEASVEVTVFRVLNARDGGNKGRVKEGDLVMLEAQGGAFLGSQISLFKPSHAAFDRLMPGVASIRSGSGSLSGSGSGTASNSQAFPQGGGLSHSRNGASRAPEVEVVSRASREHGLMGGGERNRYMWRPSAVPLRVVGSGQAQDRWVVQWRLRSHLQDDVMAAKAHSGIEAEGNGTGTGSENGDGNGVHEGVKVGADGHGTMLTRDGGGRRESGSRMGERSLHGRRRAEEGVGHGSFVSLHQDIGHLLGLSGGTKSVTGASQGGRAGSRDGQGSGNRGGTGTGARGAGSQGQMQRIRSGGLQRAQSGSSTSGAVESGTGFSGSGVQALRGPSAGADHDRRPENQHEAGGLEGIGEADVVVAPEPGETAVRDLSSQVDRQRGTQSGRLHDGSTSGIGISGGLHRAPAFMSDSIAAATVDAGEDLSALAPSAIASQHVNRPPLAERVARALGPAASQFLSAHDNQSIDTNGKGMQMDERAGSNHNTGVGSEMAVHRSNSATELAQGTEQSLGESVGSTERPSTGGGGQGDTKSSGHGRGERALKMSLMGRKGDFAPSRVSIKGMWQVFLVSDLGGGGGQGHRHHHSSRKRVTLAGVMSAGMPPSGRGKVVGAGGGAPTVLTPATTEGVGSMPISGQAASGGGSTSPGHGGRDGTTAFVEWQDAREMDDSHRQLAEWALREEEAKQLPVKARDPLLQQLQGEKESVRRLQSRAEAQRKTQAEDAVRAIGMAGGAATPAAISNDMPSFQWFPERREEETNAGPGQGEQISKKYGGEAQPGVQALMVELPQAQSPSTTVEGGASGAASALRPVSRWRLRGRNSINQQARADLSVSSAGGTPRSTPHDESTEPTSNAQSGFADSSMASETSGMDRTKQKSSNVEPELDAATLRDFQDRISRNSRAKSDSVFSTQRNMGASHRRLQAEQALRRQRSREQLVVQAQYEFSHPPEIPMLSSQQVQQALRANLLPANTAYQITAALAETQLDYQRSHSAAVVEGHITGKIRAEMRRLEAQPPRGLSLDYARRMRRARRRVKETEFVRGLADDLDGISSDTSEWDSEGEGGGDDTRGRAGRAGSRRTSKDGGSRHRHRRGSKSSQSSRSSKTSITSKSSKASVPMQRRGLSHAKHVAAAFREHDKRTRKDQLKSIASQGRGLVRPGSLSRSRTASVGQLHSAASSTMGGSRSATQRSQLQRDYDDAEAVVRAVIAQLPLADLAAPPADVAAPLRNMSLVESGGSGANPSSFMSVSARAHEPLPALEGTAREAHVLANELEAQARAADWEAEVPASVWRTLAQKSVHVGLLLRQPTSVLRAVQLVQRTFRMRKKFRWTRGLRSMDTEVRKQLWKEKVETEQSEAEARKLREAAKSRERGSRRGSVAVAADTEDVELIRRQAQQREKQSGSGRPVVTVGGAGIRALLRAKRREERSDAAEARRLGTAVSSTRVDMGLPRDSAAAQEHRLFSRSRSRSRHQSLHSSRTQSPTTPSPQRRSDAMKVGQYEHDGRYGESETDDNDVSQGLGWPPSASLGLVPEGASTGLVNEDDAQLQQQRGYSRMSPDRDGLSDNSALLRMAEPVPGSRRVLESEEDAADSQQAPEQDGLEGFKVVGPPDVSDTSNASPTPGDVVQRNDREHAIDTGGPDHGVHAADTAIYRPWSAPARAIRRVTIDSESHVPQPPQIGLDAASSEVHDMARIMKPYPISSTVRQSQPALRHPRQPIRSSITRAGSRSGSGSGSSLAAQEMERALLDEARLVAPEMPQSRKHLAELHASIERSATNLQDKLHRLDLAATRRSRTTLIRRSSSTSGSDLEYSDSGSRSRSWNQPEAAGTQQSPRRGQLAVDGLPPRYAMNSSPLRGRVTARPLSAFAGRRQGDRGAVAGDGVATHAAPSRDVGAFNASSQAGESGSTRPGSAILSARLAAEEGEQLRVTLGMPGPHRAIAALGPGSGSLPGDVWDLRHVKVRRSIPPSPAGSESESESELTGVRRASKNRLGQDHGISGGTTGNRHRAGRHVDRTSRRRHVDGISRRRQGQGQGQGSAPSSPPPRSPVRTPSQRRRAARMEVGARLPAGIDALMKEPSKFGNRLSQRVEGGSGEASSGHRAATATAASSASASASANPGGRGGGDGSVGMETRVSRSEHQVRHIAGASDLPVDASIAFLAASGRELFRSEMRAAVAVSNAWHGGASASISRSRPSTAVGFQSVGPEVGLGSVSVSGLTGGGSMASRSRSRSREAGGVSDRSSVFLGGSVSSVQLGVRLRQATRDGKRKWK